MSTTGSQYQHLFATAGTFNYHCTIHPACTSLNGTIHVVPVAIGIQRSTLAISFTGGTVGTGGIYGTPGTCSSLSVASDSVHVGDVVTWTNSSPLPHVVASY